MFSSFLYIGWLAPKFYKTICRYAEQQEFSTLYLSLYPITKESNENEYQFESDPLLIQKDPDNTQNRRGTGIITLTKKELGLGKETLSWGKMCRVISKVKRFGFTFSFIDTAPIFQTAAH